MAKDDGKDGKDPKDALTRWREAEEGYRDAVAPYMKGDPIELSKAELIELVGLRHKADRRRERYFKNR